MKTITMSFDEYRKDIQDARAEGYNIICNLESRLITALNINSNDYDREARQVIIKILDDLKRCRLTEKPKPTKGE